jgi:hypothetical protein
MQLVFKLYILVKFRTNLIVIYLFIYLCVVCLTMLSVSLSDYIQSVSGTVHVNSRLDWQYTVQVRYTIYFHLILIKK